MKVIQAKRERSDKISKVMGDYLLKGYKMLATSCPLCLTVELQDKQGAKFCVACQEVDCHETSKDDPALNQQAASRIIQEEAFSSSGIRKAPDPDTSPVTSFSILSSVTYLTKLRKYFRTLQHGIQQREACTET